MVTFNLQWTAYGDVYSHDDSTNPRGSVTGYRVRCVVSLLLVYNIIGVICLSMCWGMCSRELASTGMSLWSYSIQHNIIWSRDMITVWILSCGIHAIIHMSHTGFQRIDFWWESHHRCLHRGKNKQLLHILLTSTSCWIQFHRQH